MKIKFERSGGFAGISSCSEMDANNLPPSLESIIRQFLDNKKSPLTSGSKLSKGPADHYSYKITIKDGPKERVINCNQYDMPDSLRSAIKYMEKHTKSRL
jgi:hypothetical protein